MDLTGLIFDIVASLASVIAIGIAVRAEKRSADGLVRERKLAYELDLLRDIGEQLADGGPDRIGWQSTLRVMLLTLPGDADLPLVRAFVAARPTESGQTRLRELADRVEAADPLTFQGGRHRALAEWYALSSPRKLWEPELEKGIDLRLAAR